MNTSRPAGSQDFLVNFSTQFDDPKIFQNDHIRLLTTMCIEVDSVFSHGILESLNESDWPAIIAKASISPLRYDSARLYYKDAQIVSLIKKYPFWDIQHSSKQEAIKTFIACERQCQNTNNRIWSRKDFTSFSAENGIIYLAQKKIRDILGDTPSVSDLAFEFGPGAAYGVKYNTSALNKLGSTLDVTENCHELAAEMLSTCPGWRPNWDFFQEGPLAQPHLHVVGGDRLSFVPKTALTDRPIAIGPLLNVLIQKALGGQIRSRLKPFNNLNNRQDYHQQQALKGSIDSSICTIDLKSASDTIAYAVVQELLPPAWFELLDKTRSPYYEIDGHSYEYHKFSAMGNGFTFELESLIFFAVAFATCEYHGLDYRTVSVFGDDIIAPNAAFHPLKKVLEVLGFTVNSDKSFCEDGFRESCGGDYFFGIDVRPFYLKDRLTYRTLFLFHNFLVKKGWQFELPRTYRLVRKLLGKAVISYFKTWNELDDGALLDTSVAISSYNSIKSRYKGLRTNQLKEAFGASYILYRLQLSDKQSSNDVDWKTHMTRTSRISHRLYRYVHI